MKMWTGFTTDVIWVNTRVYSVTSEPTQSSSRRFCPLRTHSATEQLSGELHKSEVLLIASTLLVVKTEIIYRNTREMHIMMQTDLCL